jgi:NADH:ubiquinone oxidoreductase subunit 4 (subunit M)
VWRVLKKNLWLEEEYREFSKNLDINFWIVFLVLILYLIILIVEFSYKLRLNLLFIILINLILTRNILVFFFYYEIIFTLIIFVIILLGYRYERLIAAYLIIFYSFIFSRPVLILLLIFDFSFLIKNWLGYSLIFRVFMVGSFIVKFPIFGFHYWLPVAHVEASTIGSMLLAGILLKIGSIGVFYVIIYLQFIIKLHWLRIRVILTMIIILILRDLKIIIAYSSIAHIRIIFYIIMLGSFVGKQGSLVIILYHGFISPLIFWLVGLLRWWKTRSLIVVKFISFSYVFILIIFILCILNIGFPPFIGFLREVLMFKALVQYKLIIYVFILTILLRSYYNIYLFWSFNRIIGQTFKVNLFRLDLFLFILLSFFLTF